MSLEIVNKSFSLSLEWENYNNSCQNGTLYQQKIRLRQKLYDLLKSNLNEDFDLFVVGSTQSQFALKSSDLDLCLVIYDKCGNVDNEFIFNRNKTIDTLCRIQQIVRNTNLSSTCDLLSQAIVPILKFTDNSDEQICVDINVNRIVTIRNTFLLTCYKEIDVRVAPLVVWVKTWAREYGINSSYHNTLSSYSLTLMVIHFLQAGVYPPVLPYLQSMFPSDFFQQIYITGTLHELLGHVCNVVNRKFIRQNCFTISKLFDAFIKYYNHPDAFRKVISIRTMFGSYYYNYNCISPPFIIIEDPFEHKNTAYSVHSPVKFEHIRRVFRTTYECLSKNINIAESHCLEF